MLVSVGVGEGWCGHGLVLVRVDVGECWCW